MSLHFQAEPLLQLFKEKTLQVFGARVIALFKFGSLGQHGGFSLCSDVDVALMLDQVQDSDAPRAKTLWDELKASELEYADRLSLFWSSYHEKDFDSGKGRFPAFDRLDLIHHGTILFGQDRRTELHAPQPEQLISESAHFILDFLLTPEKAQELLETPATIMQKGARYFTKFVLFPVRLLLTLNNPSVAGSNQDAVENFKKPHHRFPSETTELVSQAYLLRNQLPNLPVNLNPNFVQSGLLFLYQTCIQQYQKAMTKLQQPEIATQLNKQLKQIEKKLNTLP